MRKTRPRPIRTFLIQVVLVVVVFTLVAYFVLYTRTETLITDGALAQARSYVDLILSTRAWNAHYEGVWVIKRPGVETNPYLKKLHVRSELKTTDGLTLTLRNPALMTREISTSLLRQGGVSFTLTSLKPVNPANKPDPWEKLALEAFDRGVTESWRTQEIAGVPVLRYSRPLETEASCLVCHASQGYKVGDVRGAVSVTVPLLSEERLLRGNAQWLAVAALLSMIVVIGSTGILVNRMATRLRVAEESLLRMATTDELTGLRNRRSLFTRLHEEIGRSQRTGEPIGLVMLDLDHFKAVNDEHGHAAGDRVLAEASARMQTAVREYDALGRLGGEEFLVVAPGTDLEEAVALAERIRQAVSAEPIAYDGVSITMTLSAGVTALGGRTRRADAIAEADEALGRADDALYDAKRAGRDRVATRVRET